MNFMSWASSVLDSVDEQATEKVADISKQIQSGAPVTAAASKLFGLESGKSEPKQAANTQAATNMAAAADEEVATVTRDSDTASSSSSSSLPHSSSSLSLSTGRTSPAPKRLTHSSSGSSLPKHDKQPQAKSVNRDEEYLALLNSSTPLPPTSTASPARPSSSAANASNSRSASPVQFTKQSEQHSPKAVPRTASGSFLTNLIGKVSPSTSPAQGTRKLAVPTHPGADVPASGTAPTPTPQPSASPQPIATVYAPPTVASFAATTSSSSSSTAAFDSLQQENSLLKSSVEELTQENASLKQVWEDSRQQCMKLKGLLENAKDLYQQKLRDAEAGFQAEKKKDAETHKAQVEALKADHAKQAEEWRKLQSMNTSNLDQHITQLTAMKLEHEREVKKKEELLSETQTKLEEEQRRVQETKKEIEELEKKIEAQYQSHVNQLDLLHAESLSRERKLEENYAASLAKLQSYESKGLELETTTEEYMKTLASLQRQLDSSQSELEQLKQTHRLAAMKATNDTETREYWMKKISQIEQANENNLQQVKRKLQSVMQENEETHSALTEAKATEVELRLRIQNLESELAQHQAQHQLYAASEEQLKRTQELEARIQSMAEHLLSKTSALERVTSEKTSLRLQLENETAKVSGLELQLRVWKEKYIALEQGSVLSSHHLHDDGDLERGGSSSSSTTRRGKGSSPPSSYGIEGAQLTGLQSGNAVAKAVGFIDSMGQQLAMLLRRYPQARVGFGVYIVMIHLWMTIVFYHLLHEFGQETHYESGASMPGAMPGRSLP